MTELATLEAPLTTTLKSSGDKDAPWLVIRSKDAAHLASQLAELENTRVFTDIGRVAAVFNIKAGLGANLGATHIDPQPASETFQPPAAQPVTVDATPAAGPIQPAAATPPVAAAPVVTQQAPVQSALFTGAPTGQPTQAELPPLTPPGPVAPVTTFGPAVLLESQPGVNPAWKAWGDPRPAEQVGHLRKPEFFTEDPQDPGLAGGTKLFMQRIS